MPLFFDLPFRYCTIKYLREVAGIEETVISDVRALPLIEMASKRINLVTDQWFVPAYLTMEASGQGFVYLYTQQNIPIVKLDQLRLEEDYFVAPYVYDAVEYKVHDKKRMVVRYPAFFYVGRRKVLWEEAAEPYFVKGCNNYRLVGAFGWIDERPEPVELETTTEITRASTSVTLTGPIGQVLLGDTVSLLVDYVIHGPTNEVIAPKEVGRFIVTSVTGQTVTFDPLTFLRQSIAAGARAMVYGQVPADIQEACARLVSDYAVPFGSEEALEAERCGALRSESTDGYSWSRGSSMERGWARGDPGKAQNSTGNTIVDALLSNWQAPALLRAV